MLPFSFAEHRAARDGAEDVDEAFNRCLTYDGMPFVAALDDVQAIADYLGGVFSTIVLEDVARRHPRIDMRAFRNLASFVADNVGNISSRKRIAAGLSAAGTRATRSPWVPT